MAGGTPRGNASTVALALQLFLAVLLASAQSLAAEISPELQSVLSRASPRDDIAVIVRFQGAVAPQAADERPRRERRRALVQALRAHADSRQRPVRAMLQSLGSRKVRDLWAINALAMTLPSRSVEVLAARPEVRSVTLDVPVEIPPPGLLPRDQSSGTSKRFARPICGRSASTAAARW